MDSAAAMGPAMTVRALRVAIACLVLAAASSASAADRYALVITGASGGPQYADRYAAWRTKFVDALKDAFGYPDDHVVVLAEDAESAGRRSTRANVSAALQALTRRVAKDDQLFILLIGHGTSGDPDAKFNLVGPDLPAAEWASLLRPIAGRVVFVNTSSASFEFLERLAGRGRIVVTATDSAAQQYATIFPEFFVAAFTTESADLDRNGRVSVWEAFRSASAGVKGWFEEQGRLATERPLLDDNGDGIGREAEEQGPDGALAQTTYLRPETPVAANADPAIADLLRQRAALESRLEALRAGKANLPAEQYERELEALLLEVARLDRLIRPKP
jgi:hypothetical protein